MSTSTTPGSTLASNPRSDDPDALTRALGLLSDLKELAKPRLNGLVLVTTAVGFLLADSELRELGRLLYALAGTFLVAVAASAFNQYREAHFDRLMHRTRERPVATGRVSGRVAIAYGVVAVLAGAALLWQTTPLALGLALLTLVIYTFVYTPLKRRATLNTIVGAIPGAIPPLIGWAAASGELNAAAGVLFGILFLWQVPHFLAIAWLYREDYARGGFRMLPAVDPGGSTTGQMALLYALALIPVSLTATLLGLAGTLYALGALALGLLYAAASWGLARESSTANARRLFWVSLAYLPLLFTLMLLDPISR